MGMISKMDNTQPQVVDEQEPCNWCNGPMPKRGTKYAPFCSYKCAKADAKDYEETQRDMYECRW